VGRPPSLAEIVNQVHDPRLHDELEMINNNTRFNSSSSTCDNTDRTRSDAAPPPPLHLKCLPHQRVDFDEVQQLEVCPGFPEVAERNNDAIRWARDPSRYKIGCLLRPRLAREIPIAKGLSSADIQRMLEYKVIREIPLEEVRGGMRIFTIFEESKGRRRIIRHTVDVNDELGPETVAKVDMASKKDLMGFPWEGSHVLSLDAAAFFDQLPISPDVGVFSCFRKGRKFYAATTAPTGQRHSVELAHTTLQRLIHFPSRRCTTAAIIDNAYFAGSMDDCVADGTEFLARCKKVNCTINGDTSDVAQLVKTEADCGGIHLDMKRKLLSLPQRMLDKLATSWGLRDRWSRRSFISHMGLLEWAVGLCVNNPGDYYSTLQFYAKICREMAFITDDAARDTYLDERIYIPPEPLLDLERWTRQVMRNIPRKAPKPSELQDPPLWIACVDACSYGFGYYAINPVTGETRMHGQPWPAAFAAAHRGLLHRSVFTEPNGVIMSMCHLLTYTGVVQRVHILTDSVTTMVGGNRGYNSRSADVNDCLRRLRALFPPEFFEFTFSHIAGSQNCVADALSRGRAPTTEEMEGGTHRMLQSVSWEGEAARAGQ
jgi:hypothetical protein